MFVLLCVIVRLCVPEEEPGATHFDKLFAAGVTCVELNGREARELCTQMRASGLANTRWARDHHTAEDIHPIFSGLLEVGLHTV